MITCVIARYGRRTGRLRDERGDAAFMLCAGLALFFLLLGAGVVDLWGAMTAEQNLQAIAQSAANAGASGVDGDLYRTTGEVVLLTGTSCPSSGPCPAYALAMTNLEAQPDLPAAVLSTTCGPDLPTDPDCNSVSINGGSITVTLHEEVSSLVIKAAGRHALPITVSATSAAALSSSGRGS